MLRLSSRTAVIYVLVAVMLLSMSSAAFAQATTVASCGDQYFVSATASEFGMVTQRVVICIKEALNQALQALLVDYLYTALKPTIVSLMVVALVIFGVKLTLGMVRRIPQESFMLVMKMGIIVYVLDNIMDLYPALFDITDELMGVVSTSMVTSSFQCAMPVMDPQYIIWHNLDCLLGGFVGFGGTVTLASGLLGYIVAAALSGQMGVYITFAGAGFVLSFLLSIFRGVYLYIAAMIILTFLLALSPLILPLILFKYTADIPKKWLNQIISYTLQPVVIIAFLSLAVAIYDAVLYTGPHSLAHAITGKQINSIQEFNQEMDRLREEGVITYDTVYGTSQVVTGGRQEGTQDFRREIGNSSVMKDTHGKNSWMDPRNTKGGSYNMVAPLLDLVSHPAILEQAGDDPVLAAELGEVNLIEVHHALLMALLTGMMLSTMLNQMSQLSAYIAGRTRVMLERDMPMPFEGSRDGGGGGIWGAFRAAEQAAMQAAPAGPASSEEMNTVIRSAGEGFGTGFLPPGVAQGYTGGKAAIEAEEQAAATAKQEAAAAAEGAGAQQTAGETAQTPEGQPAQQTGNATVAAPVEGQPAQQTGNATATTQTEGQQAVPPTAENAQQQATATQTPQATGQKPSFGQQVKDFFTSIGLRLK